MESPVIAPVPVLVPVGISEQTILTGPTSMVRHRQNLTRRAALIDRDGIVTTSERHCESSRFSDFLLFQGVMAESGEDPFPTRTDASNVARSGTGPNRHERSDRAATKPQPALRAPEYPGIRCG